MSLDPAALLARLLEFGFTPGPVEPSRLKSINQVGVAQKLKLLPDSRLRPLMGECHIKRIEKPPYLHGGK